MSPWSCATSASLVLGRMVHLRGKHSCALHPEGDIKPTGLLVTDKPSCGCRRGGVQEQILRTAVVAGSLVWSPWDAGVHLSVANLIDSSAGGRCCSSLPSAPCGSKASGSGRDCFCTAGCPKGLLLQGKSGWETCLGDLENHLEPCWCHWLTNEAVAVWNGEIHLAS